MCIALVSMMGYSTIHLNILVGSVALLVARRTNDRKVAGSRPTKVVCITVLTGNRNSVWNRALGSPTSQGTGSGRICLAEGNLSVAEAYGRLPFP